MCGWEIRHDTGVNNPQVLDAIYLQLRIHNPTDLARHHGTGTGWMPYCGGDASHRLENSLVRGGVSAREYLGRTSPLQRLRRNDLAVVFDGLDKELPIGGVAEISRVYYWVVEGVRGIELHISAAERVEQDAGQTRATAHIHEFLSRGAAFLVHLEDVLHLRLVPCLYGRVGFFRQISGGDVHVHSS